MSSELIQTFHQRMLPLFTPQSEKLLDGLQAQQLQRIAFRYIFSAEAMAKVSYIIEDAVIAQEGAQKGAHKGTSEHLADLHISSQQLSRLLPQEERYRQLVASVRGLWLYTEADREGDLNIGKQARVQLIDTGKTLLTRYWYVVAYGPGFGMSLLAEQVGALTEQAGVGSSGELYYEGFYSFEVEVAYQIVSILHQIFPDLVPLSAAPNEQA